MELETKVLETISLIETTTKGTTKTYFNVFPGLGWEPGIF